MASGGAHGTDVTNLAGLLRDDRRRARCSVGQLGDEVVITASPYYGQTGTILRRARILFRRVWLVKIEPGISGDRPKRRRIANSALAAIDEAAEYAPTHSVGGERMPG